MINKQDRPNIAFKNGSIAGSTGAGTNGWRVRLRGKRYRVHRIIWCILNGHIDDKLVIDHLDGNPLNNSIDNLSLKTQQANSQNRRISSANKSGVTGVVLEKTDNGFIWRAHWRNANSVKSSKAFSVEKYGYEEAKKLAIDYRKEQIELLNNKGQMYTERHTKNFESN